MYPQDLYPCKSSWTQRRLINNLTTVTVRSSHCRALQHCLSSVKLTMSLPLTLHSVHIVILSSHVTHVRWESCIPSVDLITMPRLIRTQASWRTETSLLPPHCRILWSAGIGPEVDAPRVRAVGPPVIWLHCFVTGNVSTWQCSHWRCREWF